MEERRRSKRTKMSSKFVIKRLDGGGNQQVAIELTDVSKGGIGFVCQDRLQIGEMYELFLTIWTKEVIHTILQIVRFEQRENCYFFGAVFVGIPDTEAARIEVYQTIEELRNNQ